MSASPDVLLVTCAAFPDGDEDGAEILAALQSLGVTAQWRAWDDASAPWSSALAILRAAWDYTLRRAEFLAWADTVPRLLNPAAVVRWNSDKTYLRELDAAGVPITPTAWAAPGEQLALPDHEFVLKPSVGAGSRGAGRFAPSDDAGARRHLEALHGAGRTVMLQPYLAEVDSVGETALIYVDGAFSHAAGKAALLGEGAVHQVDGEALYVEESITARRPSDGERAVGDAAVAFLTEKFGTPLYARIDLLPTPSGPVVVEVEATEPSLFLSFGDGAVTRFAAAAQARL